MIHFLKDFFISFRYAEQWLDIYIISKVIPQLL